MRFLFPALAFVLTGCASAQQDYDLLRADLDALGARSSAPPDRPESDPRLDASLGEKIDVEILVRLALQRNPELSESAARARAAYERIAGAGALDDPMLNAKTERVPFDRAGSLNRADGNMLSLTQNIPFPGNLALRSEAALRDAQAMREIFREREREIVVRVRRAFAEYYALWKEREVHLEHVAILEGFERISEVRFRTGQAGQQDLLKPQVELVALHNDLVAIDQRIESARAALNTLLDRPLQAPLGPPRDPEPPGDLDLAEISARALAERPEIRAAERRVEAVRAGLDLARREATFPDFAIELGYMHMPEDDDGWAGMVGINLPWLTGKRSAEVRRMQHELRAEEAALAAARARTAHEVRDAYLRVEAARRSVALLRGELLPKSGQSVDVSRASYEKNRASFLDLLDAERSQRDVKLKYFQAVARLESAAADLERAVGSDLRRKP